MSIHKNYAPMCALPGCLRRVDYHNKQRKIGNNGWSYKWKTFCEHHRTSVTGKAAVNAYKKTKGCEAHELGWACPGHHGDLTIDHLDGNKHNTNEDNLLVLCHNCHSKKTKLYGDNQTRYANVNDHFDTLFDEDLA